MVDQPSPLTPEREAEIRDRIDRVEQWANRGIATGGAAQRRDRRGQERNETEVSDGGTNYGMLLAFDKDEPVFAFGFEMGRLWTLLREVVSEHDEYECHCHVENAEMALRIAEATARPLRSEELGDGWLSLTFGPKEDE